MDEFPLTLFKAGTALDWDGMRVDMLIVHDADEQAAAHEDGWLLAADVAAVAAEPAKKGKAG